MVIIVDLRAYIGDPKIGSKSVISIGILVVGHIFVDFVEEVGYHISLAEGGEGHVEAALRLVADVGEGGDREQQEEGQLHD